MSWRSRSTARRGDGEPPRPFQRHLTEEEKKRLHLYTLACAAARRACGRARAIFRRRERLVPLDRAGLAARPVQSILDYIQDPSTFIFHITNPVGNFLVQYCLAP